MEIHELHVVTGAFSFTGKYITKQLLAMGKRVKTLTSHLNRPNPFGEQVEVKPLSFANPSALTASLQGAVTLYNTYWVRFPYGRVNFETAVESTKTLLKAAKEAGVRRIVHISVANASKDPPLPYYKGKELAEKVVIGSELSYAIIRPSLIFGIGDILINNIAWILRRFPVFAIPGSGNYRLQPVFVEDVAELSVRAGQQEKNIIMDAVGPEIYTFDELVSLIAQKIDSQSKLVHVPPALALLFIRLLGYMINDVVLTREELEGLMANLLVSESPPMGHTRLSDWLGQNADILGATYASELDRHYR